MTENTFTPQQEAEGGTSRTTLLVAGGLVGAVVLAGGGYLLLSGGSDDLEAGAPVVQRSTTGKPTKSTAPATKPANKPAAAKPGVIPARTTVRIGVDPFKPKYEPAPPAAEAPAAGSGTNGGTSGGTTGTTGGTTGGSSTPGLVTGQEYALTLKKIEGTGDHAKIYSFVVDGVAKQVVAAQRFGKYGELVVLGYTAGSKGTPVGAVVQVGDDEPFVLRINETAKVQ